MIKGICCVILAVLPYIVMCNPGDMRFEIEAVAVDEFSQFSEGDLVADNEGYIMSSLDGNTKISQWDNARIWPGAKVPYKIFDVEDDEEAYYLTMYAIDAMNAVGCVQFVNETDPKEDYLNIVLGDSLSSQLGNQRTGAQNLSITRIENWPNAGLNSGSIMHEFMHSLGFGHEHNRPDRDTYVEIHPDNLINSDNEPYFFKYIPNGDFNTENLLDYDVHSLMHATSFIKTLAVDPQDPVITGKNDNGYLGQRNDLTDLDKERMKITYSCGVCTGDNNDAIFRYPGDCKKYYICDHGKPTTMTCGAGLHINTKSGACDWPKDAGCTEFSTY
ncbi:unnamed protein product [Meganyctiphanes norvegica]|uniref:Metalloendopeptidase n=1 Tax=Meganyctiphanes norvegica TaxID=48144 RepID=A0AAV2Q7R5_MEGNR